MSCSFYCVTLEKKPITTSSFTYQFFSYNFIIFHRFINRKREKDTFYFRWMSFFIINNGQNHGNELVENICSLFPCKKLYLANCGLTHQPQLHKDNLRSCMPTSITKDVWDVSHNTTHSIVLLFLFYSFPHCL